MDIYRLNRAALSILKNDLGSKNYNAQILQNPDSNEDSIIKRDWIQNGDHFSIENQSMNTSWILHMVEINQILMSF